MATGGTTIFYCGDNLDSWSLSKWLHCTRFWSCRVREKMKVFGLLVVLCTSLASGVKDGSSGTPGPEAKGNTFAPSQNMTTITSPAASDTPASTTSPAPTTIAPAIPITATTVLAPAMPNTTTLAPGGTTVEVREYYIKV